MSVTSSWPCALLLPMALTGCLGLEKIEEIEDVEGEIPDTVQAAFDGSCAVASCHDADTAQAGLSLAEGDSEAILSTNSIQSGGPYVTFNNLADSYIAIKILELEGIQGQVMPPPGHDRDDGDLETILTWIAGIPIEGEGDDDDDDDDDEGSCFAPDSVPDDPSFADDVWPVIEARCDGGGSCHVGSGGVAPTMPDADAAGALVGVENEQGLVYVSPGSPDESYLWHKLVGTHLLVDGGAGSQMPLGSEMCSDELALIYRWILTGAAD